MRAENIAAEMECPTGMVTYRLSAARKIIKDEVLKYEKKSGDRLHAFVPFPLAAFMQAQAQQLAPPALDFAVGGTAAAHTGRTAVRAAWSTPYLLTNIL